MNCVLKIYDTLFSTSYNYFIHYHPSKKYILFIFMFTIKS